MLNRIDTFLSETKILRVPAALAGGYILVKLFSCLLTVVNVLENAIW